MNFEREAASFEPEELEVLLGEVVAELPMLVDLEAAEVEAWTSGLLATWRSEWPDADHLSFDRALLATCRDSASPGALVLCAAIGVLVPGVADEARASAAAIGEMLPPITPQPDATAIVGTARVDAGWLITFDDSTASAVVVGFIHADASEHSLIADLDEQGRLCDLVFAGPSAAMLPEIATTDGSGAGQPVDVVELDANTAVEMVLTGWQRTDAEPPGELTDQFVLNQLLAASLIRSVDPGAHLTFIVSGRGGESSHDELTDEVDADDPLPGGMTLAERADADAASLRTLHYALRSRRDDPPPVVGSGVALDELAAAVSGSMSSGDAAMLEWADWLGVVIGLVRAGAGSDVTPRRLVDHINRCPEVATTIPKKERRMIEDAFGAVVDDWTTIGVVDDGRLTVMGHWILPRAVAASWGGTF